MNNLYHIFMKMYIDIDNKKEIRIWLLNQGSQFQSLHYILGVLGVLLKWQNASDIHKDFID